MEMGLSQADVAKRLNVSRSVVQRLWDQYQSEDSVSRRPVPGGPRATNTCRRPFASSFDTKENNHYCAAARCRPLSSIRKKNLRYYGAKSSSQCRSVCNINQLCMFNGRQLKEPLMLGNRTCFLENNNGLLCCLRRVQIYNGE
ncbi:uncharacterized protein TNCV_3847351 [Trichonephila clavipes]|nr:uncharacterized protein TNCV_3847351 [Trichonephila clavipes]